MTNKLKIGILINSKLITFGLFQLIEKINNSDYANIELLILMNNTQQKSKMYKLNTFGYSLFKKLESKFFILKHDAFKKIGIDTLNQTIEIIEVNPHVNDSLNFISNSEIFRIKEFGLDVILKEGINNLSKEFLEIPKYGVWELLLSDNSQIQSEVNGFWEFMNGLGEIGSTLVILNTDPYKNVTLFKSHTLTDDNSVNRGLNNNYLKSLSFILRKLKELHEFGEVIFFKRAEKYNIHPAFYSGKFYCKPNNLEIFILGIRNFLNYLYTIKIRPIFKIQQWILYYYFNDSNNIERNIYKYHKLLPPKDRFWADPQIIYKDGRYYIFVEELIYKNKKAHISTFEIDKNGNISEPIIILDKPYHISFPFVFKFEEKYYMVPETSRNKTIDLYICIDFPNKWEFKQTLMKDISAVDTIVKFYDKKWWLFTNIMEMEGSNKNDELFLFYSDTLFSQNWKSHPLNPIISDVKSARAAGDIFEFNNNLFRPSQNCSHTYGYGMTINRILKWDENEYEEDVVSSIKPDWDNEIIATHTFAFAQGLNMVDARLWRKK